LIKTSIEIAALCFVSGLYDEQREEAAVLDKNNRYGADVFGQKIHVHAGICKLPVS